MLPRLAALLKTYLFFVVLFAAEKPLFLAFHFNAATEATTPSEWLQVLWHGLPLDLSCAGYFTIVPALFIALSARFRLSPRLLDAYVALALALALWIIVPDVDVYGYWGAHMDAPTILYYLRDPGDVAASFTFAMVARDLALIALGFAAFFWLYRRALRPPVGTSRRRGGPGARSRCSSPPLASSSSRSAAASRRRR